MRQPLTGGAAVCLLDSPGPKFLTDRSSDGRLAAYTSQAPDFHSLHVWTAQLDTPSDSGRLFLNHAYREANAYFAPGTEAHAPRFIAFSSAETGRDEIYICDFPEAGPEVARVDERRLHAALGATTVERSSIRHLTEP